MSGKPEPLTNAAGGYRFGGLTSAVVNRRPQLRLQGTGGGAIRSRVTSTAAPSARAITSCTIGNAYGGLPSNLIFSIGHFPLFLLLASHRWHTEALGSSAQIRFVSWSCCRYRVMTKSASRAARIIQMLMRIRAARGVGHVRSDLLYIRDQLSALALREEK